jgi:hypothetical protein
MHENIPLSINSNDKQKYSLTESKICWFIAWLIVFGTVFGWIVSSGIHVHDHCKLIICEYNQTQNEQGKPVCHFGQSGTVHQCDYDGNCPSAGTACYLYYDDQCPLIYHCVNFGYIKQLVAGILIFILVGVPIFMWIYSTEQQIYK